MPGYLRSGSSLPSEVRSIPYQPATAAITSRTAALATIHAVTSFQTNQSNMAAIMGPLWHALSTLGRQMHGLALA